jgi:hypothetical protein
MEGRRTSTEAANKWRKRKLEEGWKRATVIVPTPEIVSKIYAYAKELTLEWKEANPTGGGYEE